MVTVRGFSLIELLVCVAIVVLLTGLILPSLVNAKRTGKVTRDIEQMHQLGLANSIYDEDRGGFATGCPVLVDTHAISNEMCAASSDPIDIGSANYIDQVLQGEDYHRLVVPYKNSYPGLREFGLTKASEHFDEYNANRGWLVRTTEFDEALLWQPKIGSLYQRLEYDSSVATRHVVTRATSYQGRPSREWDVASLFGDLP